LFFYLLFCYEYGLLIIIRLLRNAAVSNLLNSYRKNINTGWLFTPN